MSDIIEDVRSFDDLQDEFGAQIDETRFPVRGRGRPEMKKSEAEEKAARRKEFGDRLKQLREAQGFTLQEASDAAGIASARKLSQYETKCYPPGWVLIALAPVYKTTAKYLAALKVEKSDPYIFAALTENMTAEGFASLGDDLCEAGE